jgi:hypothetical protein
MKVSVRDTKNFTGARMEKLNRTVEILTTVLNSEEFKQLVLNFSHDGHPGFYFRKDDEGNYVDEYHTNQQVYDKIMAGREKVGNVEDNECDLYLHIDRRNGGGDVGYGYPSSKWINTYKDWFKSFNALGYAKHLAHEWCHKLGFTHDKNRTANREFSVPYAIGYLIDDAYEQITNDPR